MNSCLGICIILKAWAPSQSASSASGSSSQSGRRTLNPEWQAELEERKRKKLAYEAAIAAEQPKSLTPEQLEEAKRAWESAKELGAKIAAQGLIIFLGCL